MENSDQVQLILPTSPTYEKVAQTTIAHLGIRSGFSLKELEDLRLVMKETTNLFILAQKWDNPLHLNYKFALRCMQVTVACQTTDPLEIDDNALDNFRLNVLPLVKEVTVNRKKAWVVFEISPDDSVAN